jgi:hypothetical protein
MNSNLLKGAALRQPPLPQSDPQAKTIAHPCSKELNLSACLTNWSRGPGSDSRRYQNFWEVEGLQRGPLSPVDTTEELLRRNSSGSGLEIREYGRGDTLRWPRDTICKSLS